RSSRARWRSSWWRDGSEVFVPSQDPNERKTDYESGAISAVMSQVVLEKRFCRRHAWTFWITVLASTSGCQDSTQPISTPSVSGATARTNQHNALSEVVRFATRNADSGRVVY